MSRDLEYEIRDAVTDLAEGGRSVNLAAAAIRDGRHLVRRRRAVSAAATFGVLAILIVPFALHRPATSRLTQPGAAPVATVPSTTSTDQASVPSPIAVPAPTLVNALPDGLVYASLPRTDGNTLVYNRSTGQYVDVPLERVVPSPIGTTAAVDDGKRVGLVDLDSGDVRWVDGPTPSGAAFDWSPDGTELTYLSVGRKSGTVRVTVAFVAKSFGAAIGGDIVCPSDCYPAWLPDGQAIAVSGADGKLPIRLIDPSSGDSLNGLDRVTGVLVSGHGVTTDRTLVVTQLGPNAVVIAAKTGEKLMALPADAAQVYWTRAQDLVMVRADGVSVFSLAGETIGTYPLPPGALVTSTSFPTLMPG